jgi:1-acyl-sn-glycerol-3-phosphate acyltransferase
LKVPVVPVRIDGLFAVRQAGKRMARPGTVRVTIGEAVKFPPEATPDEITQELRHRMMLIEPPRD